MVQYLEQLRGGVGRRPAEGGEVLVHAPQLSREPKVTNNNLKINRSVNPSFQQFKNQSINQSIN